MAAVSICVPSVSPSCCLLGGSLRSASRSDPGFFQITDSAMGLEVCKIWHSFLESRVCSAVMSDSVRPHRRQPTRLSRPWDSPGKNTGVGCHFLLQCMKVKSESEVTQSCPTMCNPMDCRLPGSSIHGIFQARVLEWGAIAFSG